MYEVAGWVLYVPGFVIVIGFVVTIRWLMKLQDKVDEHSERIAYLEAKTNGKPS